MSILSTILIPSRFETGTQLNAVKLVSRVPWPLVGHARTHKTWRDKPLISSDEQADSLKFEISNSSFYPAVGGTLLDVGSINRLP